jgi:hypothetical protein
MPFFGYFVQVHLGGIYHQIMEIGKIPIADFLVCEIKGFGNVFWSN